MFMLWLQQPREREKNHINARVKVILKIVVKIIDGDTTLTISLDNALSFKLLISSLTGMVG